MGTGGRDDNPPSGRGKRQVASLVDSITFTEGRGDEEETKKPAFTATPPHPPPSLNLLLCCRHILTLPRASSSSANIHYQLFLSHFLIFSLDSDWLTTLHRHLGGKALKFAIVIKSS